VKRSSREKRESVRIRRLRYLGKESETIFTIERRRDRPTHDMDAEEKKKRPRINFLFWERKKRSGATGLLVFRGGEKGKERGGALSLFLYSLIRRRQKKKTRRKREGGEGKVSSLPHLSHLWRGRGKKGLHFLFYLGKVEKKEKERFFRRGGGKGSSALKRKKRRGRMLAVSRKKLREGGEDAARRTQQ